MLKKVYSDLQAHGLCIHIGFEIEFVVLNNKVYSSLAVTTI